MLANSSALVSLITDKAYEQRISGYLHVFQDDHWRRLYAILKANLLFLFQSAERLEIPVLLIIMEDCIVELADDNVTGKEFSFSIKFNTTGHTYVMAAPDLAELKNWISLLTSCSIDFMLATKDSLECEHDEREKQRQLERQEQQKPGNDETKNLCEANSSTSNEAGKKTPPTY